MTQRGQSRNPKSTGQEIKDYGFTNWDSTIRGGKPSSLPLLYKTENYAGCQRLSGNDKPTQEF